VRAATDEPQRVAFGARRASSIALTGVGIVDVVPAIAVASPLPEHGVAVLHTPGLRVGVRGVEVAVVVQLTQGQDQPEVRREADLLEGDEPRPALGERDGELHGARGVLGADSLEAGVVVRDPVAHVPRDDVGEIRVVVEDP
jgi:hypothetical protein